MPISLVFATLIDLIVANINTFIDIIT